MPHHLLNNCEIQKDQQNESKVKGVNKKIIYIK